LRRVTQNTIAEINSPTHIGRFAETTARQETANPADGRAQRNRGRERVTHPPSNFHFALGN
jgi:hypothetical protein